jgi:hypothetical protein
MRRLTWAVLLTGLLAGAARADGEPVPKSRGLGRVSNLLVGPGASPATKWVALGLVVGVAVMVYRATATGDDD